MRQWADERIRHRCGLVTGLTAALLSVDDAAAMVGISSSRVRRLAEEGRLPTATHGGASWALTGHDVEALRVIAQGKSGAPLLTRRRQEALREVSRRGRRPEVLRTDEVAAAAQLSQPTVKRAAAAGELPTARKIGRQWFFTRRDVVRLRDLYG